MGDMTRFDRAALPAMPWKNGGGSTTEIACWPPGAGIDDFGWRISIARIAQAGPFSVFAGVDRSITLLDGDGVLLHVEGREHSLQTALSPFAFSGDAAVDCSLPGGPSHDFNVMTRRGLWRAEVTVLSHAQALHTQPHGLLLVARFAWRVARAGRPAITLNAGQGAWWAAAPQVGQLMPMSADARLIQVALTEAAP